MLRRISHRWEISASDPENHAFMLHVKLANRQITMPLPGGNFAGSSVTMPLNDRLRSRNISGAPNIEAAAGLVNSTRNKTVSVTELALSDGNWRDLVELAHNPDSESTQLRLQSAFGAHTRYATGNPTRIW
jgi:hypothetical protein